MLFETWQYEKKIQYKPLFSETIINLHSLDKFMEK